MNEKRNYSVIDVETTGLFPQRHDRIIEIAIVALNSAGEIVDEFESLINPKRDLGPSHIHGISGRDIIDAPEFKEIAGSIAQRLKNVIIVGHNPYFDVRFIQQEFNDINAPMPCVPTICTMNLGMKANPNVHSRQLSQICRCFDICLERGHRAIHDARATAQLFCRCREILSGQVESEIRFIGDKSIQVWPELEATRPPLSRSESVQILASSPAYLQELVSRLPVNSESKNLQPYYALLDKIMEDRRVVPSEYDTLFSLAQEIGISAEEAKQAHEDYLLDLIVLAKQDGKICEAESRDIDEVRYLLGIDDDHLFKITDRADNFVGVNSFKSETVNVVGKSVCFTGQMRFTVGGKNVTREEAEQIARRSGMVVRKSVTKDLDILVVADPDSMSGKALTARVYGTRIVAENVFWNMMGARPNEIELVRELGLSKPSPNE